MEEKMQSFKLKKLKTGSWAYILIGIIMILIIVALIQKKPTSIQIIDLQVSSSVVKKIDNKTYRYFFDIWNNDTILFDGNVEIKLLDSEGSFIWSESFTPETGIAPRLGSFCYFDHSFGPKWVISYGVAQYEYIVKLNGRVVNSGRNPISIKYEDLTSYY